MLQTTNSMSSMPPRYSYSSHPNHEEPWRAAEAAPGAASAGSSSGSPSGVNDPPPLAVGAAVQAVVVDITGDSAPDDVSEDSGDGPVPPWRPQLMSPPLPAQRRTPPATRGRVSDAERSGVGSVQTRCSVEDPVCVAR